MISKKIKIIIALGFYCIFGVGQTPCLCDLLITDSLYTLSEEVYTGPYRCYYNNGNIESEGYINMGKIDSISKYYNSNGKLAQMSWYKDNHMYMRRIFTYLAIGNLITTLDENDKEHGLFERYYPNGNINERQFYDHGNPIGIWTTWDKKGRIEIESDFTGDFIIRRIHDYKSKKHKILVQHFDKETNKQIYRNLIIESEIE